METKTKKLTSRHIFNTVEEAVKELQLDKRRKWYEWGGELVYNCEIVYRGNGKREHHSFPENISHNGKIVKIIKKGCTSKKGCISALNSEYFKDCIGCPKLKPTK